VEKAAEVMQAVPIIRGRGDRLTLGGKKKRLRKGEAWHILTAKSEGGGSWDHLFKRGGGGGLDGAALVRGGVFFFIGRRSFNNGGGVWDDRHKCYKPLTASIIFQKFSTRSSRESGLRKGKVFPSEREKGRGSGVI